MAPITLIIGPQKPVFCSENLPGLPGSRDDADDRNRSATSGSSSTTRMLALRADCPNASSRSWRRLCHCRLMSTGQSSGELSELADPAIDGDRAAMLLGHDIIADRQAESCRAAGQ